MFHFRSLAEFEISNVWENVLYGLRRERDFLHFAFQFLEDQKSSVRIGLRYLVSVIIFDITLVYNFLLLFFFLDFKHVVQGDFLPLALAIFIIEVDNHRSRLFSTF